MAEPEEKKDIPDPKLKKEASYTYWVNNDPNFFKEGLKPETTPQKLEIHQIGGNPAGTQVGHSAWNSAGTWEEKKIKFEDVQKVFNSEFKEFALLDKRIVVKELKNLSGEVHLVLSRGKKRLGYHIKFTLVFEGVEEWKDVKGKIKFLEFFDDGEREMEIEVEGAADEKSVKEAVQKSGELISNTVVEILNNLKN